MAVQLGGRTTVLLANLRPEPATVQVRLAPTGPGADVAVRSLTTETPAAMLAAESYRTQTRRYRADGNVLCLPLLPYEYTRLDYESA
jgi:hypothetical protein